MTKISEIYNNYKIMPNLQLHQLRVASVAEMICDSLSISVDKEIIIKACLLHDMGNIIKFKLDQFPEWISSEGLEYWETVKHDFITKYGINEHQASIEIAREIGISPYVLDLVSCIDASYVKKITDDSDFNKKICAYVDNRVSPYGIVSIDEHSLDAKKRYENHPHSFDEESRLIFNKNLFFIEKQIFSYSNIKPEDINDESAKKYLEKLKDFSI